MARTPNKFTGDLKEAEEQFLKNKQKVEKPRKQTIEEKALEQFVKINNLEELEEIVKIESPKTENKINYGIINHEVKAENNKKLIGQFKYIRYDSMKNLSFIKRFEKMATDKLASDLMIVQQIHEEIGGKTSPIDQYRILKVKDNGNVIAIEPLPEVEKVIWNENDPESTRLQLRIGICTSPILTIKQWENLTNARGSFKDVESPISINDLDTWKKTIQYCRLIGQQMGKQYEELEFTGYQNNKLLLPNKEILLKDNKLIAIDNKKIRIDKDLEELDQKLDTRFTNDELTKEEKQTLLEIIKQMRGVECWGAWVTAVHLSPEKVHRPPISCFGLTGKGKTDGFRMLSKVGFGIIGEEQASTLRSTVAKRYMDTTNIGMFILDDIKDDVNFQMDMNVFIRCARDRQSMKQATAKKGMLGFELRAPLVVTGESKFTNQSTLNRLIEVDLNKQLSQELWDKLEQSDDLLIKLKSQLIKYRLSRTDQEIETEYQEHQKHLKQMAREFAEANKLIEPRAIETYAPVRYGLSVLEEILGAEKDELVEYELQVAKKLLTSSNIFEENLLKWIIDMIRMDWIRPIQGNHKEQREETFGIKMSHRVNDPTIGMIAIRISKFKELLDRLRKENVSEVEVMKLDTLTKRLKTLDSKIIEYKKAIRFTRDERTSNVYAGIVITMNHEFKRKYHDIVGGKD